MQLGSAYCDVTMVRAINEVLHLHHLGLALDDDVLEVEGILGDGDDGGFAHAHENPGCLNVHSFHVHAAARLHHPLLH